MAGRKDHHGLGMIDQNIAKRRKQRAFFVFERAAANQNRPAPEWLKLSRRLATILGGRRSHIEFQVAGDGDL
jgi:hypothetical protein